MYSQAGAQQGAQTDSQQSQQDNTNSKDDIQDADFEEVH
jgi:hypothetical protein